MINNVKDKDTAINEKTSLLKLTWPISIENFLAMLIGNIDSIMLSNYSETAVGAVGNCAVGNCTAGNCTVDSSRDAAGGATG